MRTRDAGILLVSGLAIFLALESGTEYEVQQRWALELKPTLYRHWPLPFCFLSSSCHCTILVCCHSVMT
eukprot:1579861-Rhodomonas_salina.1